MNQQAIDDIQQCLRDLRRLGELSEMLKNNPWDEVARLELDDLLDKYCEEKAA